MGIADLTPEEREQVYLDVELSHLTEDARQQVTNLIELGFQKEIIGNVISTICAG